jgi:VanZ family protein
MSFLGSLPSKRAAAIGWYALIIMGSSVPGNKIPEFFLLTPDKLIHCAEYLGLGFLVMRWFAVQFTSLNARKLVLQVLVVGAICGMADEFYQNLTPRRSPDFYDWCLDFVGVAIGIILFFLINRRSLIAR